MTKKTERGDAGEEEGQAALTALLISRFTQLRLGFALHIRWQKWPDPFYFKAKKNDERKKNKEPWLGHLQVSSGASASPQNHRDI